MKKIFSISMVGLSVFLSACGPVQIENQELIPALPDTIQNRVKTENQEMKNQLEQVENEATFNENQADDKPVSSFLDWKIYEDTNTQDPEIIGTEFSIKYPSSWTYQKFNCNVEGVAFCPLKGNTEFNCRITCDMNSPQSPIYLYPLRGEPIINESEKIKYWKAPNISLHLIDEQYRDIYRRMITTFNFNQ